MSETTTKTAVWQISSSGVTKTRLEIDYGAETPVTVSGPGLTLKSRGEFTIGGRSYTMQQQSALKMHFELTSDGSTLASARQPSMWCSRFEVTWGDVLFELKPAGWLSYDFTIEFKGQAIGRVKKSSMWNYSGTMEIPATIAPEFGVFLYWLCYVSWQNTNAIVAGG